MLFTITPKVNGRKTTSASITFGDANSAYGMFDDSDKSVVIASGTAFDKDIEGVHTHTFTADPSAITYKYALNISAGVTTYYSGITGYTDVSNTVTIPTTDYFSSEAEVRRVLGNYATEMMLDDDDVVDTRDFWIGILADVDDTMNMYMAQHYDPSLIKANSWMRRRATTLAVNLLSQRRGNAPLYVGKTEKTYEELEAIKDGRFHLPGASPTGFQGAMVRNYLLQGRFRRHPLRVEGSKSTGVDYPGQDVALEPYVY